MLLTAAPPAMVECLRLVIGIQVLIIRTSARTNGVPNAHTVGTTGSTQHHLAGPSILEFTTLRGLTFLDGTTSPLAQIGSLSTRTISTTLVPSELHLMSTQISHGTDAVQAMIQITYTPLVRRQPREVVTESPWLDTDGHTIHALALAAPLAAPKAGSSIGYCKTPGAAIGETMAIGDTEEALTKLALKVGRQQHQVLKSTATRATIIMAERLTTQSETAFSRSKTSTVSSTLWSRSLQSHRGRRNADRQSGIRNGPRTWAASRLHTQSMTSSDELEMNICSHPEYCYMLAMRPSTRRIFCNIQGYLIARWWLDQHFRPRIAKEGTTMISYYHTIYIYHKICHQYNKTCILQRFHVQFNLNSCSRQQLEFRGGLPCRIRKATGKIPAEDSLFQSLIEPHSDFVRLCVRSSFFYPLLLYYGTRYWPGALSKVDDTMR